jgi:calpain-7
VQRVVADCSLCASIIVCLQHSQTHDSQVRWPYNPSEFSDSQLQAALPSLYPRGLDGRPQLSPKGGYELKILFNGAHRRVKRAYDFRKCNTKSHIYPLSIARLVSTFAAHFPWCERFGLSRSTAPVVIDDRLPFRPDGRRMCMTSKGRKDIWPSLVEKAVRMGWFPRVVWSIYSHTVSENHGRVRFPWLVRVPLLVRVLWP